MAIEFTVLFMPEQRLPELPPNALMAFIASANTLAEPAPIMAAWPVG
jgi:hypothetical protein